MLLFTAPAPGAWLDGAPEFVELESVEPESVEPESVDEDSEELDAAVPGTEVPTGAVKPVGADEAVVTVVDAPSVLIVANVLSLEVAAIVTGAGEGFEVVAGGVMVKLPLLAVTPMSPVTGLTEKVIFADPWVAITEPSPSVTVAVPSIDLTADPAGIFADVPAETVIVVSSPFSSTTTIVVVSAETCV